MTVRGRCPCGWYTRKPYTRTELAALRRLRGRLLLLCPLCRHEIDPPTTVRKLRQIAAVGSHRLAHRACVDRAGADPRRGRKKNTP